MKILMKLYSSPSTNSYLVEEMFITTTFIIYVIYSMKITYKRIPYGSGNWKAMILGKK